jgi:hypothetical protein
MPGWEKQPSPVFSSLRGSKTAFGFDFADLRQLRSGLGEHRRKSVINRATFVSIMEKTEAGQEQQKLAQQIAVDIVLLPPAEIVDYVLRVNARLVAQSRQTQIVLHPRNCLPHASLWMGCCEVQDLAAIEGELHSIARTHAPITLSTESLKRSRLASGQQVATLEFSFSPQLSELHRAVRERIYPFCAYQVSKEMFFDPDHVEETALNWVTYFPKNHSHPEKFTGHITLGVGDLPGLDFPGPFCASRLALCHLGSYCTCRKVLCAAELNA